ncbi:retrovirus-related pol polyprotein from transposon TNT 1-94 [Tanacetum coccineum]
MILSRSSKFKYTKKPLVPSCEKGKSKKASHPPKPVPNSKQRLHLLHMDLCGPMRVESINEKRYVLVIVDDYSRYTWVIFLRSKDEAPEVIKTFLKRITVLLQSPHLLSVPLNKNGVSERRNRSCVAARNNWALCYPKNDCEDIGKLGAKGDIAMYDDYIGGQPSSAPRTAPDAQAPQALHTPTATTTTADTAPTPTNSSSQATNCPNSSQDVDELETQTTCMALGTKNVKEAMTDPTGMESSKKSFFSFKRLDVWC